ncbi:MAG: hypothetical protein SGBAC_001662 [Bacillariaceae sp.]
MRSIQSHLACVVLFSSAAANSVVQAFLPSHSNHHQKKQLQRSPVSCLHNTEVTRDDASFDLLEKAKKLREEAEQLEQKLREDPQASRNKATEKDITVKTLQTKLEESIWTFSYRFSSQPKDEDAEGLILPNYSGKITVRLTADGYSEVLSKEDGNQLGIGKVWGWDKDYSQEDRQEYLLFSMDVTFPKTDPLMAERTERCYWQCRIDTDPIDNSISLNEGTVTVKKDISNMTKGMWGIFQVSGILTQFRYVGDFSSKPAASLPQDS